MRVCVCVYEDIKAARTATGGGGDRQFYLSVIA